MKNDTHGSTCVYNINYERRGNRMVQQRAIKYAIYPTKEQLELFCQTFGCVRFVWNQMLSDCEEFLAATGKVVVLYL